MLSLRKDEERGHFDFGWLDTRHSFSFGNYYDPGHMGFRSLRVINEDRVKPGAGFPTHPHRDMEIITYVLEGALEHRDSMGTGSVIRAGELQRMSAGTGVTHSEYNYSRSEPVHFLQIWILPAQRGLRPSYDQKAFPAEERRGRLQLVASPDGADGSLTVHQDARLYLSELAAGQQVSHELAPGRGAWLQVTHGAVDFDGHGLAAGDGAAVVDQDRLTIAATSSAPAEVLLFDLG